MILTSPEEHEELNHDFTEANEDADPTKGETPLEEIGIKELEQEKVIAKLDNKLNTLAKYVDDIRVSEEDILKRPGVSPGSLLEDFHALDYDNLKHYYERLSENKESTAWLLFMEGLTLSGSKPAGLLIKHIIEEDKESLLRQIAMLIRFPFNAQLATVKLVKEFEKLFEISKIHDNHRLHDALILSVSNLLIKTCPVGTKCHETAVPDYAKALLEKFIASDDYEDKLSLLQAIGNLECAKVANVLMTIVLNEVETPVQLRYLAIYAAGRALKDDNEQTWEHFLPLFLNRNETDEIRIAAFYVLVSSQPTFLQMQSIVAAFNDEPDADVKQYVYTTLKAKVESTYPCSQKSKSIFEFALRHLDPLPIIPRYSGEYKMGYTDEQLGFGSESMVSYIKRDDDHSNTYVNYHSLFMDQDEDILALYIRLEGFQTGIIEHYFDVLDESLNIEEIKSLLEKLNVHLQSVTPTHIDIVVKRHGKTVFTAHFNETTASAISKILKYKEWLDKDVDAHYLRVSRMHDRDITFTTELGLPIVAYFSTTFLNVHRLTSKPSTFLSREVDYDMQEFLFSNIGIDVFNPFGDVFQGIGRSNMVYADLLSFDVHLDVNFGESELRFETHRTKDDKPLGGAAFTETTVYILRDEGDQLLHSSCPTCKNSVTVSKDTERRETIDLFDIKLDDAGVRMRAGYFECDKDISGRWLLDHLKTTVDKDSTWYGTLNRLYLKLLHRRDILIFAPRPGRCGFILKISNDEEHPLSKIEGKVKLKVDKSVQDNSVLENVKRLLEIFITFKGEGEKSVDRHWELNFNYDFNSAEIKNDVDVRFTRRVEAETPKTVCLKVKRDLPDFPADIFHLPTAEEQKINGKIYLEWGESEVCPTGAEITSGVRVVYELSGTEELRHKADSDEWPYKRCREEHDLPEWIGPVTPATPACFNAAFDQTLPRKFHYNVKLINLSEDARRRLTKVVNLLRSFGGLYSGSEGEVVREVTNFVADEPAASQDELDLTFELSVNRPEVDITVKTAKHENHYHNISYGNEVWKPKLLSTRFPVSIMASIQKGLIGRCTVNSEHVITLGDLTLPYESVPCYTLLSADCRPHPLYAVFAKRIPDTNKLALKVYTGGNYVEVIPSGEGYVANINGVAVEDLKEGQSFPKEEKKHFRVWEQDHVVTVVSKVGKVLVKYSGNFVYIAIPQLYSGKTCGLCGHYDSLKVHRFDFPDKCQSMKLSHAYTLQESDTCQFHEPSC